MKPRMIAFYLVLMLGLVSCDSGEHASSPSATQVPTAPPPAADVNASSTPASATGSAIEVASTVAPTSTEKGSLPPDVADTTLQQASAEIFGVDEIAYVTAPRAAVDMNGTVISLPIGTSVKVKGTAESCSFEGDSNNEAICVFIGEIYGDEIDPGFPDGLASANRFGHKRPTLTNLLAEYDKTPKGSKNIRRELGEKAITLAPWSDDAQRRVLEALHDVGDQQAVTAAEETFRRYQEHRPQVPQGELPTVFHYDGQRIMPFAANVNGVIQAATSTAASHRGTFFYIYGNNQAGFAVTTQTFLCDSKCPTRIPVQNLGLDGKPTASKLAGIYATNFVLPEKSRPLPAVTREQKDMLTKMLRGRISNYAPEAASAAEAALRSGKIDVMSGQLSVDGRIFLVGGLHIGSASDEHYNGEPFISEFVILEQQEDGSFTKASTNVPSFKTEYCSISGVLSDMNGDGADEIITYCNSGVEGPYGDNLNGIVQRVNNQWVKAF